MTNEERDLITGLFNRLKSADNPQKDREAEGLIQQSVTTQPSAPYLLVQTVLVQEHALSNAQERIGQLEKALQDARRDGSQTGHNEGGVGSFLAGLFGGHSTSSSPANPPAAPRPQAPPSTPAQGYAAAPQGYAPQNQSPYPTTANLPPSAGGSFLKSALGTAAGVAGGAMLFQGIQNLLGHNAGPFGGGGFGGGSGFFGGSGGYNGPEIIENREVVNNYYDERGNRNDNASHADGGNFLGEETVGFRPHESNDPNDTGNGNFLGEETVGFRPHEDNRQDDPGQYDTDNAQNLDNLFTGTPDGDVDTGSVNNDYDSGNTDAGGGDFSGGNDDSSYA